MLHDCNFVAAALLQEKYIFKRFRRIFFLIPGAFGNNLTFRTFGCFENPGNILFRGTFYKINTESSSVKNFRLINGKNICKKFCGTAPGGSKGNLNIGVDPSCKYPDMLRCNCRKFFRVNISFSEVPSTETELSISGSAYESCGKNRFVFIR